MKAIIPKRTPIRPADVRRVVRVEMERFGGAVMSKTRYPPQNTAARPVFRKRKRKTRRGGKGSRYASRGYRRTGTLRRSWSLHTFNRGGAVVVRVASSGKIAPYNIRVQGPKEQQAELFARYGWLSVPTEAEKLWPKAEKRIEKAIVKAVS